jgi:uncharacterized protein (TIGR02452 family)
MDFTRKPGSRKDRKERKSFNSNPKKYNGNSKAPDPYLSGVYQDTVSFCLKKIKVENESILYDISELESSFDLEQYTPFEEMASIKIINDDTLNVAEMVVQENQCPLVLNMASKFKPGGGVRNGKMAQEEEIFRRTNAFMTHPEGHYPLGHYDVIYSPEVWVIKDDRYEYLRNEFDVGMVAVHAIKSPKLKNERYSQEDYELTCLKIESIFMIGLKHQYKDLLLGALGSGAYRNPPQIVAKIFKKCISKYGKYFKNITFAIYSVKDNNYDIFSGELS